MKNLLVILLTIFVGISVVGCYKNISKATKCGKNYSIYVSKDSVKDIDRTLINFFGNKGYDRHYNFFYKFLNLKDEELTSLIIAEWWEEDGSKIRIDFITELGCKCSISGFDSRFEYYDSLFYELSKVFKSLDKE